MPRREIETVRIGAKHQVTLPSQAVAALGLHRGDYLEVRLHNGRIELLPVAIVPRHQAWFWTPEWQAREKEADEALALGDFTDHKDVKGVIDRLKL